MEEKIFKNDIWFNSSHQILESSGQYRGIDFVIRYDQRRCIRCLQINVSVESEDWYIKIDNPWLKIADFGTKTKNSKLNEFADSKNFVIIIDEYFNNPDPKLMGTKILKTKYRPYDQKHIGTADYYENLAIEFIDWYLENFQ